MVRLLPTRSPPFLLLSSLVCSLLVSSAGAQPAVWAPFIVTSADYRDLDGDLDMFPDTGETGRVAVTLRVRNRELTEATFILVSSDSDVDCITERRVTTGDLSAGQTLTVGSLDPLEPGFTFKASDALSTVRGADPARVELCLRAAANEIQGLSEPVCFSLFADLDLPGEATQTFIPGPDLVTPSADDGTLLESFDADRDGDGDFTVNDTFRMTDGGTGLTEHGFYLRGSNLPGGPNTVLGVPCGGFRIPAQGNPGCILDPSSPMDWHIHCPPGSGNCPNAESGPGPPYPTGSYTTPTDGQKALSPPNSLHMGIHLSPTDSWHDTYQLRSLQAFVSSPINLALFPRPGDLELSMFHIARLMDDNGVGGNNSFQCADCADVQVQLDGDPDPAIDDWGMWEKLVPFQNVYDHVAQAWSAFGDYYCRFTTGDAGTAPPAPRGAHETLCFPQGAWSSCGSVRGTDAALVGDCAGPGVVDPSGTGVWVETKFNLASFLGQRVRLRWIGSMWMYDDSLTCYECLVDATPLSVDDGWWLDNIHINGVVTTQVSPSPDTDPAPGTTCTPLCPDIDGDGYGEPGSALCPAGSATDCEDADPTIYPGAPEINDGLDNQCPGSLGYGVTDEISGIARFTSAEVFWWEHQGGGTDYLVVRSDRVDFASNCVTFLVPTGTTVADVALPPVGSAFFYLVRAEAPLVGSWGQNSSGAERTICIP